MLGCSCVGVNCLVVFQKLFSFFYPLFKPLKILLKFTYTPTLKAGNYIAFLTFTSNLQCQRNFFNVVQVKTRLLTCLYNNEKTRKILRAKCSAVSAPPYPPHGVELLGAESLQSPTLTGPPARGSSATLIMRIALYKSCSTLSLPCGRHFLRFHEA